ncbi:MAG: D-2-hydroxyacid dehydrogenase [Pseudomonadota bacterium]
MRQTRATEYTEHLTLIGYGDIANAQHNIVFLDQATLGPGLALREPSFPHHWTDYRQTNEDELIGRASPADILINNKVRLTAAVLDQLPNLKLVAMVATGTNVIDLEACTKAGVVVSNIRDYATTAVPEHTLAVILALRRNLFRYREEVLEGAWQASKQFCFFNTPMHDLNGTTLGILGTGSIAMGLGKLAQGLGIKPVYHSLGGRQKFDGELVSLDVLFGDSDIVSIHCPLTEKSAGLVSTRRLQQMKSNAILVNTARGEIVDLEALQAALQSGHLGGAAIDVVPTEPPPHDHVVMELAKRPDVIVTPHVAWASAEARQTMVDQLIDNLDGFVAGHPRNVVNPEVLDTP